MRSGEAIREETMSPHKKCGWTGLATGDLSRREILQAGLTAAAAVVAGTPGDALAQNQADSKSRTKQALGAAGVGPIDIHAHYYPQAYLDLLAEEGKRFKADYRMTGEGFYVNTPAGSVGPLPTKFIDLRQRLA